MTPLLPYHPQDGRPTRMWCGKADRHERHKWFATDHPLTPMRCRGSSGDVVLEAEVARG